jgi:hypothetical protein
VSNPFGEFNPDAIAVIASERETTKRLQALIAANRQTKKVSFFGITIECEKPANAELNEQLINLGMELISASQHNEDRSRLASSHATEPLRLDGTPDNQVLDKTSEWFRRNPSKKDSTNS